VVIHLSADAWSPSRDEVPSSTDTRAQALKVSAGSVKLWAADNTLAQALYSYTDTLTMEAPALKGPADGISVTINPQTGMTADVVYSWSRVSEATEYDLWIALDSGFTETVLKEVNIASTASTVVEIIGPYNASSVSGTNITYSPNTTYYWKVRARAPVVTPYSSARKFTVEPMTPLTVNTPASGAVDVNRNPTLVWTALPGATSYNVQIDSDPSFTVPEVIAQSSVPFYFLQDKTLEYSTVYYWRVRALGVSDEAWVTNVFTTMAEPVAEAPAEQAPDIIVQPAPPAQAPNVTVEVPPAEAVIPSYLLWTIIGIGAVLVIALIVLIVRTRRVV